jgi:hypothetical protein
MEEIGFIVSIWDLKTIFERGRAENDEIPKSSFPFQPQTKTVKKFNCQYIDIIAIYINRHPNKQLQFILIG